MEKVGIRLTRSRRYRGGEASGRGSEREGREGGIVLWVKYNFSMGQVMASCKCTCSARRERVRTKREGREENGEMGEGEGKRNCGHQ